ncbi:MAG: SLBB domain-containing protein [Bacteroidales bacterium]|nr:SLBB domain-containing protein [Bacteroidales bacterium]
MHKRIILLLTVLLALGAQQAFAQMSDSQIISYITSGVAAGKSEGQIASELMAKGVTTSQLQRLMKAYKSGNTALSEVPELSTRIDGKKTSTSRKPVSLDDAGESSLSSKSKMDTGKEPVEKKPRKVKKRKATETIKVKKEVQLDPVTGKPIPDVEEEEEEEDENPLYDEYGYKRIYGHDIFTSRMLSFEPNQNMPTPEDYVLGPGDEVIIDVWGTNEASIKQEISPEGRIIVSQVGPINLAGLTVKEAQGKVKASLTKIFSSLRSGSSNLSLTLGNIRSIQVNVFGEVEAPGTYRLSSFATVFTAIYRAGGIKEIGSLRNVKLIRGSQEYATIDVYEYIFNGKLDNNIALKEGDVINVPAYSALVSIEGFVKRPMFYEMRDGEPISSLITYAGGYSGGAWQDDVSVERNDGKVNHIYTVKADKLETFGMRDGDAAYVKGSSVDVFTNKVEIKGAVYRPGSFALGGDIVTVGQLVKHAGGLLEDAFVGRAQIVREKSDRSLEIVSVPLKGILDGNVDDILLKRGDVLIVSNVNEIELKGDLSITGYVANPGKYQFAEHTTVEDLILLAGGLSEGASSARVDVARRITNPASTEASDTLAMVFAMSIKDGLLEDGAGGFELQPYDVVSVRRSPTYIEQRNVTITGEVTFPGQYTLVSTNERVSDLVKRAGGSTPNGNVRGAMLKRKINQYERNVRTAMSKIVTQSVSSRDTLDVNKLKVSEIYTVGLELDKALAHPGSDYDVVLRDGDELIIPEMASTVRVQGEVLYPNTVHFISGKPVGYYVRQAGGFSHKARRAKTYVIYMNGMVAIGAGAKLEPGCEIVVPGRSDKDKLTTGEWLGIGTTAASITTMIATIASYFK